MYNVMAKHNGAYAILSSDDGSIEALTEKELKALLYFGTQIEGVSFDVNGNIVETINIPNMDDSDIDKEEYDDDDIDFEDSDFELDFEDEEEEIEDYEDEEEMDDTVEEFEDDSNFLGEDIYDEDEYFDDSIDIERSSVQKLYDYLDAEQVKLLKRYYLWYSQHIFETGGKDSTYGIKDARIFKRKQDDLSNLRAMGDLWCYAGFIDMGYDGAGYCTLGHPLRYMHIAWDATVSDVEQTFFGEDYDLDFEELLESNNCITFGIKCISDFFEVDKECMDNLKRAQRESLKDMELMCVLYSKGKANEVCSTFKEMDALVKYVKRMDAKGVMFDDKYKQILPTGYVKFYEQFRSSMMIPPKSLVQVIRDKMVGWVNHKFTGSLGRPKPVFGKVIQGTFGGIFKKEKDMLTPNLYNGIYMSNKNLISVLYVYLFMLYAYDSCGYYAYNADTNKDEGGKSRQVVYEFEGLYKFMKHTLPKDMEFTYDYAKRLVDASSIANDIVDRLNVIYSEIYELIKEYNGYRDISELIREYYYDDNNRDMRKKLNYVKFGMFRYFFNNHDKKLHAYKYPYNIGSINTDSFLVSEAEITDFLNNVKSYLLRVIEIYNKLEEERIARENERIQLQEEKEETVEEKATMQEVYEYIKDTGEIKKSDYKDCPIGVDVWNKKVADPDYEVSAKQYWYLQKVYKVITGKDAESYKSDSQKVKHKLSDNPQYAELVDWGVANSTDTLIKSICKSVKKYGEYTDKQAKYILEVAVMKEQQGE